MFLIVGGKQFIEQRRLLANAQPVEAEIIFSEVKTQRSSDTDSRPLRDNSTVSHYPEVRFRYAVNGAAYESDRLRPTIIARAYASREAAAAELAAFPIGARVTDPALPDKAYLIAEKSAGPLVFLILGAVLPPRRGSSTASSRRRVSCESPRRGNLFAPPVSSPAAVFCVKRAVRTAPVSHGSASPDSARSTPAAAPAKPGVSVRAVMARASAAGERGGKGVNSCP